MKRDEKTLQNETFSQFTILSTCFFTTTIVFLRKNLKKMDKPMLLSFTVSNYRSFKDKHTLSLEAASIQEHKDFVREVNNKSILPTIALYGANSSGKSNLLSAMRTMQRIVMDSVRTNASDSLYSDSFALDKSSSEKPTFFEVVFSLKNLVYRYSFEYTSKRIVSEWLYDTTKGKEKVLFIRNKKGIGVKKEFFPEGDGKEEMTAENRLFLSLVAQLNGQVSKSIMEWFRHFNVISGINDDFYKSFSIDYLSNESPESSNVRDFLKEMDLGFLNLKKIEQNFEDTLPPDFPEEIKQIIRARKDSKISFLKAGHMVHDANGKKYEEFFDVDEMESEGTKKLLNMSGPIISSLMKGQTIVIDEFDAKLHPLLTKRIIEIFNSPKTNPNNAQMVFATHDTNLLSNKIMRRDQIWFAEKNRDDETTDIYPLSEIKEQNGDKIRNDRVYEKDYINGKYGAIPFLRG